MGKAAGGKPYPLKRLIYSIGYGGQRGIAKTCSRHVFVLADARIALRADGPPSAQNRLSPILSNGGPSTSLRSANKKAPWTGGCFIGGQRVLHNTLIILR